MVKINKTLGLALLTALAAGCSSDNDVAQAPEPVNNNGSAAYATLRIDLPTQQGSRAVEEFNDGLPAEYKVNDATLLVFKKAGSSEGEYTFVEKVDLQGIADWTKQNKGGITTTADLTAKLTVPTLKELTDGNYYGLVILNNKSGDNFKITLPDAKTTPTPTYSGWNVDGNANAMQKTQDGIVMANAPEWKTSGTAPTTLVQINGAMVKSTEELAKAAGPAAEIHVERGLAKVTMTKPNDANEVAVTDGTYKGDKVAFTAWALDVTNKKSFPVHKIDGLATDIWTYDDKSTTAPTYNRFQDHTAANSFKRVFWGIDPNYNTDYKTVAACEGAFKMAVASDLKEDFDAPQYCLENTFDINHMLQGQTTRVLLKATYKIGNADKQTFYKFGSSKLYTNEEDLKAAIKARYLELNPGEKDADVTVNLDANNIKTAGVHPLSTANFTVKTSNPVVPTEKISTYVDGVCYYIGRIKHFGDDQTPWHAGESYGGDNLKYLGRYGVLRNNWYNLSVHSVVGPGEPDIPEVIPENPDDDDTYIDLSVKILQWAKHSTQELDI